MIAIIPFFACPLVMVVPLAVVSTSCDELLDELNELSAPKELHPRPYASHLLQSQRDAMTHADYYKIESLLNYLKGLNNRQGEDRLRLSRANPLTKWQAWVL